MSIININPILFATHNFPMRICINFQKSQQFTRLISSERMDFAKFVTSYYLVKFHLKMTYEEKTYFSKSSQFQCDVMEFLSTTFTHTVSMASTWQDNSLEHKHSIISRMCEHHFATNLQLVSSFISFTHGLNFFFFVRMNSLLWDLFFRVDFYHHFLFFIFWRLFLNLFEFIHKW